MTDNEHTGERVVLYILLGIGIFALGYLFFKDQFKRQRQDTIQTQSLGQGRTSSILSLSNPRINELERQTIELETQTGLLQEKLKSYDYQLNQLSLSNKKVDNTPKMYQLSGQPARAGSVNTVRTTVEDKVRQKDFGMN